jgi:hypothetical protein
VAERREFQRLKLVKPILGTLDGRNALILDVGVGGAFVEHYGERNPGDRFHLAFGWEAATIEFICEARRSVVVRTASDETSVSHTGARFVEAVGDSQQLLERMMATFVARILAAQRANARGERESQHGTTILELLGDARRMRARGFVTNRFRDGLWSVETCESPIQPEDGFTVAAHEDDDELQVLRETYESADDEGRRLIRLVAQLSATSGRRH